jgi:serine/threonine-protein kinase
MKREPVHIDRQVLQQMLDDRVPSPRVLEMESHLAECDLCRHQLELLAGDAQWWSSTCDSVREILKSPADYLSSADNAQALSGLSASAQSGHSHPSHPSHQSYPSHYLLDDPSPNEIAIDFLEPSEDPAMLGRLGAYEILEVIGKGGMGIVFKGFQHELHRCVAVKALAPHLALSAAARRRFEREAQATAAVVHPHVMAIHSVDANARLPYLVMPYITCESLQQRLDRQGPLKLTDVLRVGMQSAQGLAAAHAQGLVHRDVKPANILLETNVDRVMLTDFGLARAVDDATLTRTGIIAGTPMYMSPEQANDDPVDHRSDLFSLGSVLYAMCTGRPPFRAETTFGVLRRIREATPRSIREINPEIPEWFESIVWKLLAKSPADRLQTASDVASLLEQCLAHVQQPTAISLPMSVAEWVRSNRHPLAEPQSSIRSGRTWLAVTVVVLIGLASVANFWQPPRSTQRSEPPVKETSSAAPDLREPHLRWDGITSGLNDAASTLEQLESSAGQELGSINDRSVDSDRTQKDQP